NCSGGGVRGRRNEAAPAGTREILARGDRPMKPNPRTAIASAALAALLLCQAATTCRAEEGPAPNDLLLGVLWTQRSVEFKATALGAFTLAKIRLDQALADKSWTA